MLCKISSGKLKLIKSRKAESSIGYYKMEIGCYVWASYKKNVGPTSQDM